MQSNLMHELRQLLPATEAKYATAMIGMLMDGIWVRMAVTKSEPSREEAIGMINDLIDKLLSESQDYNRVFPTLLGSDLT